MNKKKVLKYLNINELENKVFKELKQERKRHGNKRQESETARQAEYKQHGSRNQGEERELRNGTGIGERNGSKRKNSGNKNGEFFLDEQHGRSRAEDGKTNKERKNKLKIKTEIENRKEKPR